MSNKKISELPNNQPLDGSEVLPLAQSGNTVKTSVTDITNFVGDAFVQSTDIDFIQQIDQATYDGLGSYDSRTLYVIV